MQRLKGNTHHLDDTLFFSTMKANKPIVWEILHPNETDTAPVSHTHNKLLIFLSPTSPLNHDTAIPKS